MEKAYKNNHLTYFFSKAFIRTTAKRKESASEFANFNRTM